MDATNEQERRLDAPTGFTLPELGGKALGSRLFHSEYFDVPGGSLADAGITLRRRTEDGASVWQLELPAGDARLELEAPDGPAELPAELRRLLTAHLRHESLSPVAELGRRPADEKPSKKPLEALRALLRVQLREILANDPGTRLGVDPESLHDMRVAVRRSRALLRAGRKLFRNDASALRNRLKALGTVLGAVRDLDVMLDHLCAEAAKLPPPDEEAAGRLLGKLELERASAREAMLVALDGEEYLTLLDDFEHAIDRLEPSGSGASLAKLARRELKRVRKAVRALPKEPSDEELHEIRKLGKRARYATELAGQDSAVKRAKTFQDVLGEHQDSVVAEAKLRELAEDAAPEEARAAGRLIDGERTRRARARAEWRDAWRKLERAGSS